MAGGEARHLGGLKRRKDSGMVHLGGEEDGARARRCHSEAR